MENHVQEILSEWKKEWEKRQIVALLNKRRSTLHLGVSFVIQNELGNFCPKSDHI